MRTVAAILACAAAGVASADVVEDQNGLADQLFSGIAVVTVQDCGQVVTTGVAGALDSVDLQIWKSPGTVNDVTIRILSVTAGVPDPVSTGTLFETIIPIEDLPTFDGIPPADQLPLTNVDVSAGGLDFDVGDQFAVAAFRAGPGSPPWVLWGRGNPSYPDGDGFISNTGGEIWSVQPSAFGFRTFVDEGGCPADCNGDGSLSILDFVCFQQLFQNADPGADCNGDGTFSILDFVCFQQQFQAGCP